MTGQRRDCHCPRARHQHGTRGGYQSDGCRCFPCRLAYHELTMTYKIGGIWHEGQAPLIGVMRRLQALHAIGWSFRQLAEHIGHSRQSVSQLANGRRLGSNVCDWTARRIDAMYGELGSVIPTGTTALRARRSAERRGWVSPLAWDDIDDPEATPYTASSDPELLDELLIERAMRGEKVPLTKAERTETITRLAAKGVNKSEIARRLRMSYSEVQRRTQPKKAA